jgi:penicillin-binding protein 2
MCSVSPFQLALMPPRGSRPGRIARTSKSSCGSRAAPPTIFPSRTNISQVVRDGMDDGCQRAPGPPCAARLAIPGVIRMAGKTGTAQVRRHQGSHSAARAVRRKYRDHGLFVCFAPVATSRAMPRRSLIEHGMGGVTRGGAGGQGRADLSCTTATRPWHRQI